jgi:hypothetical protein
MDKLAKPTPEIEAAVESDPQVAPPAVDGWRGVLQGRAAASAQIARTLKAWRAAKGEPTGRASIPEGGGAPLSREVRAHMEPRLGAELGHVRVHTGSDSARAANTVGARAFTVGSDVHFNHGEYAPGSREGDKLLAHELTHTVQAQQSGVQRKPEPGEEEKEGEEVSHPEEPAEKEADEISEKVAGDLHGDREAAFDDESEKKKKKEAAPSIGAKLFRKIFRFRSDRDLVDKTKKDTDSGTKENNRTTTLLEDKRKLLKTHVELIAKEAQLKQQALKLVVQATSDIVVLATGPFSVAAQGVVKTITAGVTTIGDVTMSILRDLEVAMINRAIEKMNEEQLEAQLMSLKEKPAKLEQIHSDLKPQLDELNHEVSFLDKVSDGTTGPKKDTASQAANAGGKGFGATKDVVLGGVALGTGAAKTATDESVKEKAPGWLARIIGQKGGSLVGVAKDFAKKVGNLIPVLGTVITAATLGKTVYDIQKLKGEIKQLESQVQGKETAPECSPDQ